jgi:hypothetical protein
VSAVHPLGVRVSRRSFFVTTISFRPTLEKHRDDAVANGLSSAATSSTVFIDSWVSAAALKGVAVLGRRFTEWYR